MIQKGSYNLSFDVSREFEKMFSYVVKNLRLNNI